MSLSVQKTVACRTCLSETGDMISLYEEQMLGSGTTKICEAIKDCSSVQFSKGDGLPDRMCKRCVAEVTRALCFRDNCEKSDARLRNLLVLKKDLHAYLACRMCLVGTGDFVSIYTTKLFGLDSTIIDMIKDCVPIEFSEGDGLPDQMCIRCVTELTRSFLFRQLCTRSDITLRKTLLSNNNMIYEKSKMNTDFGDHRENAAEDKENETNGELLTNSSLHNETAESTIEDNVITDTSTIMSTNEVIIEDQVIGEVIDGDEIVDLEEIFDVDEVMKEEEVTVFGDDVVINEDKVIDKNDKVPLNGDRSTNIDTSNREFQDQCTSTDDESSGDKDKRGDEAKETAEENNDDEKPFICELCGRGFRKYAHLNTHLIAHDKAAKKVLVCEFCGTTFKHNKQLKSHIYSVHKDEKPHVCEYCDKSFIYASRLKLHIKTHIGDKPFSCDVCSKCFLTTSQLKLHASTHTGAKPFKCTMCSKAFGRLYTLEMHMQYHTGVKPHKCGVCNKGFQTNAILIIHMRSHTGEKPFECRECGKCFASTLQVRKHLRTHTGEKPYVCGTCNRGFSQRTTLVMHERFRHTPKDGPDMQHWLRYKCHVCGKCFGFKSSLRNHLSTHSEEKPHVCTLCNHEFAQKRYLNIHMQKWHLPKERIA